MSGRSGSEIHEKELRIRAERLLAGCPKAGDLDRLFLDLRDRAGTRHQFQDIANFVAHRRVRERGVLTEVARDVYTSLAVWSRKLRGLDLCRSEIARAAYANLRLVTDQQLKEGCGLDRGRAKRRLKSGLPKFQQHQTLGDQEAATIAYLGDRFVWKPAYSGEELFKQAYAVLIDNGLTERGGEYDLERAKNLLSLYAVAIMHGSAIDLEDGTEIELRAGFANRDRYLEVKMQVAFHELAKPVYSPVCIFLTNLLPEDHCDSALIERGGRYALEGWREPIELEEAGKLRLLS